MANLKTLQIRRVRKAPYFSQFVFKNGKFNLKTANSKYFHIFLGKSVKKQENHTAKRFQKDCQHGLKIKRK